MKIKLFTHGSDIDGNACVVLAQLVFGKENVNVEFCEYNNVNEVVMKSDCFDGSYDFVFITDISLNPATAIQFNENIIKIKEQGFKTRFKLLDHHATAMHLNMYDWASVKINIKFNDMINTLEEMTSGAYEFWLYLLENGACGFMNPQYIANIHMFTDNVRRYDTWLWSTVYNDIIPKQINDLYKILGRNRWIERVYDDLMNPEGFYFSEQDFLMLGLHQEKIDKYIWQKNQNLIRYQWSGYTMGIVFAEQFLSELGNELCKQNPDIDFVALVNPAWGISYRTVKDIDLSAIAKQIGNGGGHAKSAGSGISDAQKVQIIDILFGG